MKRLLALMLTVVMLASLCLPVLAETVPEIKEMPAEADLHPDPQDPYKDPTEGFYRDPIKLGETERDSLIYEPTTSYLKMQTVFIAAPAGENCNTIEKVAQWLIDTGWVAAAESEQFRIACMFTETGWAEDPADEFAYLEGVRGVIRKRVFWNAGNASFYLVGYEGGADVVSYAAMTDPTHYAGLVTFGGKGQSVETISFCQSNCVDHEGFLVENMMRSEMDARTWMFIEKANKDEAGVAANVAYWKEANDVAAETLALSSAVANEIYCEPAFGSLEINEHSVGALWLSYVDDASAFYAEGVAETVYTQFLQKAWRFEAFPNSSLRAYEDPVKNGSLVRYTMEVDGWVREYYVHCPETVIANGAAAPLVICTHGSGGTGKEMSARTDWMKVADHSGFVVVFPTSLYKTNSTGAGTLWNSAAPSDENVDDIKFIRSMVEQIKADYPIDAGRVYSTGHSNGTSMAICLALACPDIITACATSAPVFGETSYDPMLPLANKEYKSALMVALGTNDEYAVEQEGCADITGLRSRSVMSYWKDLWGFDADTYGYYVNGVYEHYVFTNADNVPVYHFIKANGNLHAPLPEYSYNFYEFMSQYSRGEDGTLYYQGVPVK